MKLNSKVSSSCLHRLQSFCIKCEMCMCVCVSVLQSNGVCSTNGPCLLLLCHSIVSAAIQNISDENVLHTEAVKQIEALKKHEYVSEECRRLLAIDVC